MASISQTINDPDASVRILYEKRLNELVDSVKSAALSTNTVKDHLVNNSLARLQKVVNTHDNTQDIYDLQDIQLIYDQALTEQLATIFKQSLKNEQEQTIKTYIDKQAELIRELATTKGELIAVKKQLEENKETIKSFQIKLNNYDEMEKYAQYLRHEAKETKRKINELESENEKIKEDNKQFEMSYINLKKKNEELLVLSKDFIHEKSNREKLELDNQKLKEEKRELERELSSANAIINNAKIRYKQELQTALISETQQMKNDYELEKSRIIFDCKKQILDNQTKMTYEIQKSINEYKMQFEREKDNNYVTKDLYHAEIRRLETDNKNLVTIIDEKSAQLKKLQRDQIINGVGSEELSEDQLYAAEIPQNIRQMILNKQKTDTKLIEKMKMEQASLLAEEQKKTQLFIDEANIRYSELEKDYYDLQNNYKLLRNDKELLLKTLKTNILPEIKSIKEANNKFRTILNKFFMLPMYIQNLNRNVNELEISESTTEDYINTIKTNTINKNKAVPLFGQKMTQIEKALNQLKRGIICQKEMEKIKEDQNNINLQKEKTYYQEKLNSEIAFLKDEMKQKLTKFVKTMIEEKQDMLDKLNLMKKQVKEIKIQIDN